MITSKQTLKISLITFMVLLLTSCGHKHQWVEATCTEPKTCSECGKTEGEPLGHSWLEATCDELKTCEICGKTEGEPLGHDYANATCTEPKICKRCGRALGKPLGHNVEEWIIIQEATSTETGTREGTCSVCGETVSETIEAGHLANGINLNESDWDKWKSKHSIKLFGFMAAAKELDFTWTIPENGDSEDKICYLVDENNNEVEDLYLMYQVKSNKITYVALYTENENVLESDNYKQWLNKLMQAYTAEPEDGGVNIVVSDERATEIINYIIDNRIEHCLVDGMKIRGLFSEDEGIYGITIGY